MADVGSFLIAMGICVGVLGMNVIIIDETRCTGRSWYKRGHRSAILIARKRAIGWLSLICFSCIAAGLLIRSIA